MKLLHLSEINCEKDHGRRTTDHGRRTTDHGRTTDHRSQITISTKTRGTEDSPIENCGLGDFRLRIERAKVLQMLRR